MPVDSVFLDFTVFKGGFEAGRYAALSGSRAEPKVQMLFRPASPLTSMELTNATPLRSADSAGVRVEHLDPGVNYLWRVRAKIGSQWLGGGVVRIQAPTCPSDEAERAVR
jgi:hypothetical protein